MLDREKNTPSEAAQLLLDMIDNLRFLQEEPQRIRYNTTSLYTYGIFRKFCASYYLFVNFLIQQAGISEEQFTEIGFGSVDEFAIKRGIIEASKMQQLNLLHEVYSTIHFYTPKARNEMTLLEKIYPLTIFMGVVVSRQLERMQ